METDVVKMFSEAEKARAEADKNARKYQRLTRRLFGSTDGAEWLRMTMGGMNFMGSVFTADMNALGAAYQDGRRSVISDILNTAAMPAKPGDDDE